MGLETQGLIKGKWYKVGFKSFDYRFGEDFSKSGVYAIYINGHLKYIGESSKLSKRLNNHIQNICRYTNDLENKRIFFKIRIDKNSERKLVEQRLIKKISPTGNIGIISPVDRHWNYYTEENCYLENKKRADDRRLVKLMINKENNLTKRESDILIMRLGLDGKKVKTLQEIGNCFNLTRERIRQIIDYAIYKLNLSHKKEAETLIDKNLLVNTDLSKRCINSLNWYGIKTRDRLIEFVNKNGFERLYLIKNFGRKSMDEVKSFLKEAFID